MTLRAQIMWALFTSIEPQCDGLAGSYICQGRDVNPRPRIKPCVSAFWARRCFGRNQTCLQYKQDPSKLRFRKKLEKAAIVDLKQHSAQRWGQGAGQCRPEVRNRFAFHPSISSISRFGFSSGNPTNSHSPLGCSERLSLEQSVVFC